MTKLCWDIDGLRQASQSRLSRAALKRVIGARHVGNDNTYMKTDQSSASSQMPMLTHRANLSPSFFGASINGDRPIAHGADMAASPAAESEFDTASPGCQTHSGDHGLGDCGDSGASREKAERSSHQSVVDSGLLLDADGARRRYDVDGSGVKVAILDSGVNRLHADFGGNDRSFEQVDFTGDALSSAAFDDQSGHGSHLAGIVAGRGIHTGIAPGADLLSMRVLSGPGASGDLAWVERALTWLLDDEASRGVSVVLLAVADGHGHADDSAFRTDVISEAIRECHHRRIPVVVPAGNLHKRERASAGMAYPAVCAEAISVAGSVCSNGRWRLTDESQRSSRTTIAAPAGPYVSSARTGVSGSAVREGTSQAAAAVAGALALLQRRHFDMMGSRARVGELADWLRHGARGRADKLPVLNVEGALNELNRSRGRNSRQRLRAMRSTGSEL